MNGSDFPISNDDLTPDHLTAVLRRSGHLGAASVVRVAAETIGAGVGVVGQLAKLTLTYDQPDVDLPSTMIAKFASPYPDNKDIAQFYGFYRTEAECYSTAQRGGLGVTTPMVYSAQVSDDDRDTLLLIEDLTHLRMADQVAGATLAEAEVAMDAAADLHARWWQHPDLDQLSWLRPINNPAYKAGEQQYAQVWPFFVQKFGDVVAAGSLPIAERHGGQIAAMYDRIIDTGPLTLSHADYRLDNLLFDDAAQRVVVIDWQLSVRGSGAADVSYLLVQSMTIEARREHGEALVRRWFDRLVAHGVTGYSWNDAFTDFRRGVLLQLPIGVVGTTAMEAANDRGRALQLAMATRNMQALVDYDCAELHLD